MTGQLWTDVVKIISFLKRLMKEIRISQKGGIRCYKISLLETAALKKARMLKW